MFPNFAALSVGGACNLIMDFFQVLVNQWLGFFGAEVSNLKGFCGVLDVQSWFTRILPV